MPLLEELPGTFEGRGQVRGAAPASRTPPPPPPRPATDHWWHFPTCCVASYALRSGLNCLQELIVQALGPKPLVSLFKLVSCLFVHHLQEAGGPTGVGIKTWTP